MTNINAINQDTNQFLKKADNLSDLPNRVAALDNLGIPVGYQTLSLVGNYTFTNPPDFANFFTPNASIYTVFLPIANATESIEIGHGLIIANDSPNQFFILKSNDGTDTYAQVNPGESYYVYLVNDSTPNGTWLVYPVNYLINNNTSNEAINVLSHKNSCLVATTGNLNATYFAGSGNGFGATLTSNVPGNLVIDGINVAINKRVLVKDQTLPQQNGLYTVVNPGNVATPYVIQRTSDYFSIITNNALNMIAPGDTVVVAEGTLNSGSIWMQTQTVTNIGVDPISFININNTATFGSPRQLIYVAQDGSDVTGTGTIEKPFATVGHAYNVTTDASFSKPYTIIQAAGFYNETNINLKPWINWVGAALPVVNITGNLTIDAGFNDPGLQFIALENLFIFNSNNITWDLSALPNDNAVFTFFNNVINGNAPFTWSIKGSTTSQSIWVMNNNQMLDGNATFSIENFNTVLINNSNQSAPKTFKNSSNTNPTQVYYMRNFDGSNLTFQSTGLAGITTLMASTYVDSSITIDGANAVVDMDQSSFLQIPTLVAGGTYNLKNISNGLNANFTPTNYTPIDNSVNGHLRGINNALFPVINTPSPDNLVIGGDFSSNPWQRGTSFTPIAGGAYSADRFRYFQTGFGSVNINKQADAPTFAQAGIATNDSLKMTVALTDVVGAITFYGEQYLIEGFDWAKISQQPFTLSFWVKSSQAGVYCMSFQNGAQDRSYVVEYTISLANTWQKISMTIPTAPTSGTWDYTNQIGLRIVFTLTAGATLQTITPNTWVNFNAEATANQTQWITTLGNTFQIALVQLTSGSTVLPFVYQNQNDVIGRCQRYFEKSYNLNVDPATNTNIGSFNFSNSAAVAGNIDFDVRYATVKRATPNSVSLFSIAGTASTVTQNDATEIAAVAAGVGASGFRIQATNDALKFGAAGHYTCDAEL